MSQYDTRLEDLRRDEAEPEAEPQPAGETEAEGDLFSFGEPEPQKADLGSARSLVTEPHPAGFGEVLVTDAWVAPPPREAKEGEEPRDRQREWETRQELRQLGLLRERPLVSYDARFEQYWGQVKEAMAEAVGAIVDPYTAFAAEFADAPMDEIGHDRRQAGEYGREGDALLRVGRGCLAIGRNKAARSALEAAAKAEPQHREVWYNLGLMRLFGRANARAREALQLALDQAPGDFRAELALGVACYHLRDYAAAEGHFRRLAGSSGLRATARSMLACSQRMQGNWDGARIELGFLKQARPGDWPAVAEQCLDCVERGEQKREGLLRAKRRAGQMWRALAAAGAGGVWLAYGLAEDLFRGEAQWALLPLLGLALLVVRALRGISGRELSGEFGNAEQGIPCWQANTWLHARQSEF